VSFSPNSKLLASTVEHRPADSVIELWDVKSGFLLHTLFSGRNINSVAFSPDSKLLATASNDGIIQLWDADTGVMQQVLEGHRQGVLSVSFSPDGRLVASGSHDMTLRLWDVNIDAPVNTRRRGPIYSLALSPDERTVASASGDRTVRLWESHSGMLQRTIEDHSAPVVAVQFSPDGKIVASGSEDGSFRLWAVDTGALRHTSKNCGGFNSAIWKFTFSPDSKLVALASMGRIILRAADTGGLLYERGGHPLDQFDLGSLAFSPDSKLLVSVSDSSTELYSVVPISTSWNKTVESCSLVIHRTLEGPDKMISPAVFSPDGRLLALPSISNTIKYTVQLWATSSGIIQQVLGGHREMVIMSRSHLTQDL
jgi:WD40 repeat protein